MEHRDNVSDPGEVTYEMCKAQLKLTQSGPFFAPKPEDLEEESKVAEEDDPGTDTVILEGREINLSDSGELTPEKIKEALAKTRIRAQDHAKRTREISTGLSLTPTKAFRTMKFKKLKTPDQG